MPLHPRVQCSIVKASRPGTRGIRGYDGFKKINGRKRHLLVDTQGLIFKVQLSPAQVHDSAGAKALLASCRPQVPRLRIIWADQAYRGLLGEGMQEQQCRLEIVYRSSQKQLREQVWATACQRQQAGADLAGI